jgi:hypothetical protein
MKVAAACLMILSAVAAAWAVQLKSVSIEELLQKTDLIVMARLVDVTESLKEEGGYQVGYGSGNLTVSETIRGTATNGQTLRLEWLKNHPRIDLPSINYLQYSNKNFIWLLRKGTNGSVFAGHGRVLDPRERGNLNKLLKKKSR